jgi:hypothetical protein
MKKFEALSIINKAVKSYEAENGQVYNNEIRKFASYLEDVFFEKISEEVKEDKKYYAEKHKEWKRQLEMMEVV